MGEWRGHSDKSDQLKLAFLAAFRRTGVVVAAAEAVEIHPRSIYRWKDDPDFAADFEDARKEAAERLVAEAHRRAVEGVGKPVYYRGEQCGTIQEYSDRLLELLLKGEFPEKYRERYQPDPGASAPQFAGYDPEKLALLATLSDEQLQALRDTARILTATPGDRGGDRAAQAEPNRQLLPGDGAAEAGVVPEAPGVLRGGGAARADDVVPEGVPGGAAPPADADGGEPDRED